MSERQVIPPVSEPVKRISFHPHRLRRGLILLLQNAAEATNILGYASYTEPADSRKLTKITLTPAKILTMKYGLTSLIMAPALAKIILAKFCKADFQQRRDIIGAKTCRLPQCLPIAGGGAVRA
jgi:hypothetical protein